MGKQNYTDLAYFEIFNNFKEANTRESKIQVLRDNDSRNFRQFLKYFIDPNIQFYQDIPDYIPSAEAVGINWTNFDLEVPKLYRFIKGNETADKLSEQKRKELLLVILESLHAREAELLISLFHKDLEINYLTPDIIREAFGDNL